MPRIHLEQNVLSDFDEAVRREWLVTNGIGGYASSTVLGINTRKYHGLLVAAFNPPVDRWVLFTKLDEEIRIGNETHMLGSKEFKHGISPEGYRFLLDFSLDPFPTYKYVVHGVRLQKTIFMPYGKNATIVIYDAFNPNEEKASIRISPLVNSRHFHDVTDKNNLGWNFIQKPFEQGMIIQPSVPLSALIFSSSNRGFFVEEGRWVEEIYFTVDASRGESCIDDCFRPGWFEFLVASKERKKFYVIAVAGKNEKEAQNIFSSIHKEPETLDASYCQEIERRKGLLTKFQERYVDLEIKDWLKWLILATDSFLVNRESTKKKTVIAGYHWFEDWGRDSLISLPGLTLVTGRFEDAREILLTFKRYCHNGIIPNRFPDRAGDTPIYNTVDATLWFFNAILQYLKYTGDFDFVQKELWDTLKTIIENHVRGTVYSIHMEDDGLIAHGPQLTWMDATANNHFVTPRDGKAVEIQALWYNALKTMELLAKRFDQKDEQETYSSMAEKAAKSFIEKFWNSEKGFLFDVVHKEQTDSSLRPNQVIAAALDFSVLGRERKEEIVEIVWKKLLGTYGLKTLPDDDPRYVGEYFGDWNRRGNAYHNGTVWAWLIGPFTTAFLTTKNHEEHWRNFAFKNFLQPLFQEEIFKAGLGTISEIFDGNQPHSPRGCIAQAWSVAEPLRALVEDVALKRPPHEREVLEILS
ncbi:MAG: glycogen debranching enzyme N-terminal domain-containing protein [Candidatus Bathyarchaeota archaeon]|nr:glycogen debranching enzyme N-terminal domain-containing protein [Candidatus Bathyarchaeota archaeon]